MHATATDRAVEVVRRARTSRNGELTITIGTGCCESTAPFLYESFFPGTDQAVIGDVDGVPVFAPAYLRELYPDDDEVVIDAVDVHAESMSIETEWGVRLILRGHGVDLGVDPDVCVVPDPDAPRVVSAATGGASQVRGELPEALARLKLR